jgi:signal transduction histidine kinase
VDRHLARARAAGAGGAGRGSVPVRPVVDELVRALKRLHAAHPIDVRIDGDAYFAGDRQDLVEMLGNLLDNAWQWARGAIGVTLAERDGQIEIRIEDDGPGMPAAVMAQAVQPFARLDEAAQGSGLGLAIVRDVSALYGGALDLAQSPMGGLMVNLRFPAASR